MTRVPVYSWEPSIPPILAKQAVTETWIFQLEEETSPGSGRYVPLDLTGLTATFSLHFESSPGSGVFVPEITDGAMSLPGNGFLHYARSASLVLPEGDHLGEIALLQGSTVIARVPGGRRYIRIVVGRKLGA